MATYLGSLVGGFLAVWLFSRLFRRLLFSKATGWRWAIGPTAMTLIVGTVVGGYGYADGGPPRFLHAFLLYLVPALFWGTWDVGVWQRGRRPESGAEQG